jgi:hypothetical protein
MVHQYTTAAVALAIAATEQRKHQDDARCQTCTAEAAREGVLAALEGGVADGRIAVALRVGFEAERYVMVHVVHAGFLPAAAAGSTPIITAALGRAQCATARPHFTRLLTFIEPQGTHIESINPPHLLCQAARL